MMTPRAIILYAVVIHRTAFRISLCLMVHCCEQLPLVCLFRRSVGRNPLLEETVEILSETVSFETESKVASKQMTEPSSTSATLTPSRTTDAAPVNNTSNNGTNGNQQSSSSLHQGVLYKRRDVFQKRWRPRWFVLDESGVLTYYLFDRRDAMRSNNSRIQSVVLDRHAPNDSPVNNLDYDVQPRGTIYLPDCTVTTDDELSQNGWFVFKISPPDDAISVDNQQQQQNIVYLSTTSEENRTEWIEKLSSVCGHSVRSLDTTTADEASSSNEERTNGNLVDGDEEVESFDEEPTPVGCIPGTLWKQEVVDHEDDTKDPLEGVPDDLADRIQTKLRHYLPFCRESSENRSPSHQQQIHGEEPWKKTLDIPNGVTVYRRKHEGHTMIKTIAVLGHHPKQLFNLLVDIHRRREIEQNVRQVERLQTINPHTFLDHYAYRAVWPTTARDFAVAVHWRMLQDTCGNNAICMFGFSDPAADELRPPSPNHVRANLLITLTILRLVDSNRCHLTRILSFDLCGNVPKSLTNTILQQQSSVPVTLTQHLTATEAEPEERLSSGELRTQTLIDDVIERLPERNETAEESVKRRLKFEDDKQGADDATAKHGSLEPPEMSILSTAVILLSPLVLWRFADRNRLPGKEIYFCLSVILALRAVVLGHLGRCIVCHHESTIQRVTCHFTVDLKGVLRFIANRKEEQQEENTQLPEVSIVHIVVSAIAKAMQEVESLNSRHVRVSPLGVDGYYLPRSNRVDISLLLSKPQNDAGLPEDLITLHDVQSMSVEDIVEAVEKEKQSLHGNESSLLPWPFSVVWDTLDSFVRSLTGKYSTSLGSCLVVASPDSADDAQVDLDAVCKGVNVVVVVGGVRLEKHEGTPPRSKKGSPASSRPTLVMSLSIQCPVASVQSSRQFAERIQQLLQFPEICEEQKIC